MMRRIVASSLKFRRLIVALAAGLIVVGVTQAGSMPVDQLPEFGPTMVEVRTEALGLSAVEVEQLITVPLEQDLLNGIAFVDEIHSASLPGLSSVVMTFEPGTPLLDARQVVQEKVAEAAVALPGVSAPPQMLQPYSATSRVLAVRLSSSHLTPLKLSEQARWVVVPRLLGVHGVANVSMWGFRDRQLQVRVDPERLRATGLTLQQIVETTGNALWVSPLTFLEASTPGTAGFIDTPNQRLSIRHEPPITSAEDLAEVPIEEDEGRPAIPLGDVTQVVEDHQPLIGDAIFPDGGTGLLLVVEKFPNANTVEVSHGVEEALELLSQGLPGVQMDTTLFRPADYVEGSAGNLATLLALGGALILLVLSLFTFEWRSVVTSAVAIAASLVVAGLILTLREIPLNVMVLAGLVMAIGVVVHDAVTDVAGIRQRLRLRTEGDTGTPAWRAVLDAAVATRGSLLFATFIAVAVVLPAFFLDGQGGAFLPWIVGSYLLVVVASMAVALVLTPSLALMLMPGGPAERRESPVVRWVGRRHASAVARAVRRPRWAYVAIAGALVAGAATLPFLDREPSVRLQDDDLLVQLTTAPGTSLPAMTSDTREIVDALNALPGIEGVSAHVGRAVHSDQVVNVNSGQIWVGLDGSIDRDTATASIGRVLASYPDISHRVTTYAEHRIADVLEGRDRDVVVRVYGADLSVLDRKAEEIRARLKGIDGIRRPTVERAPTEPTIEVEVRLDDARRFGVVPGDVRRSAAILLSGLTVGNLFEDQKVFDVVVWGQPQIRESVDDVEQLLIDTPTGDHIRLHQVADVRVVPNPTALRHEAVSNYLDVSADVSGRDAQEVVADVRRAVLGVEFPLEHHAEIRGAFAEEESARSQLLAVALAATLAVFLLLQAAFTSWRLAILAFVGLPIALVGGLVAALIAGGSVGLGSFAGLLGVLALAARNAILLIREYQELESADGETFGDELVRRGTEARMGPTLIAAVATIAALVPLVFLGGTAGLEIAHPMAVVMIGGLVTSTLFTLVVLPSLYRMHGFVAERDTVADELVVLPEAAVDVEPATQS